MARWTVTDHSGDYVIVEAEGADDAVYEAGRTGKLDTDDWDDNDLVAELAD